MASPTSRVAGGHVRRRAAWRDGIPLRRPQRTAADGACGGRRFGGPRGGALGATARRWAARAWRRALVDAIRSILSRQRGKLRTFGWPRLVARAVPARRGGATMGGRCSARVRPRVRGAPARCGRRTRDGQRRLHGRAGARRRPWYAARHQQQAAGGVAGELRWAGTRARDLTGRGQECLCMRGRDLTAHGAISRRGRSLLLVVRMRRSRAPNGSWCSGW